MAELDFNNYFAPFPFAPTGAFSIVYVKTIS
jgi:hypothetical protein